MPHPITPAFVPNQNSFRPSNTAKGVVAQQMAQTYRALINSKKQA